MTDTPLRGEVWLVALDPTVGVEIQKTRPAVVLSSDRLSRLPIRLVVPLTSWQERFVTHSNKVRIPAHPQSGLLRESAADVLQLRSAALERFVRKLGQLDRSETERLAAHLLMAVDYNS